MFITLLVYLQNWFNRKGEASKTIVDDGIETVVGSYPGISTTLPHGISTSTNIDYNSKESKTASLPQSFFKGKLKSEVSIDLDILPSTSTPDVQKNTTESVHYRRRGKLLNTGGLYFGLKQLRCLFDVSEPGFAPEESVVAAMLDLVS